jgi:hypothetical protein
LTNPSDASDRTVNIPSAGNTKTTSAAAGNGSSQPITVNLNISGNEIINEQALTYRINQAGNKRGRYYR